jgi:PHP family Zn ribbon phosphoesterase
VALAIAQVFVLSQVSTQCNQSGRSVRSGVSEIEDGGGGSFSKVLTVMIENKIIGLVQKLKSHLLH